MPATGTPLPDPPAREREHKAVGMNSLVRNPRFHLLVAGAVLVTAAAVVLLGAGAGVVVLAALVAGTLGVALRLLGLLQRQDRLLKSLGPELTAATTAAARSTAHDEVKVLEGRFDELTAELTRLRVTVSMASSDIALGRATAADRNGGPSPQGTPETPVAEQS